MSHPFAGLIIRSVLLCYSVWGGVAVYDLMQCESKRPGQCEPQRSELRGAATSIPATLLAWLADSPVGAKPIPKTGPARPTNTGRKEP